MKVIYKINRGYNLTVGKKYTVKEFCPQLITRNFTFPRYVSLVEDDNGKEATGHAYRFTTTMDGMSCEEYIKQNFQDITDYN